MMLRPRRESRRSTNSSRSDLTNGDTGLPRIESCRSTNSSRSDLSNGDTGLYSPTKMAPYRANAKARIFMGFMGMVVFYNVFWANQAISFATMNEEGFSPVARNVVESSPVARSVVEFSRVARNDSANHLLVAKYFDLPGVGGFRGNHDCFSSGSKEKDGTMSTRRLQMHTPPPVSCKMEPMFDSIDRNLYYPSSNSSKVTKADYYPRTVRLDPSVEHVSRKIDFYKSDFTDNTQFYGILPSEDEKLSSMEIRKPYSSGECVPMQEWQTTFHPSCNGIHELALETIGRSRGTKEEKDLKIGRPEGLNAELLSTDGYFRYAWRMTFHNHHYRGAEEENIVFKNLKYEHFFEDGHFENDRIDAIAMERLTSSPHVVNIFGFCGHSVMTDCGDGKRLGTIADHAKNEPLKRLTIARDIASGLADIHGIDGHGNSTFVHLDINPANVISVNGTLKFNDFNIGILRKWNTTSNQPCGFTHPYANPQWRSPEEARNESLTEKVDVFSLGHILFRLICGHEPWNAFEPNGKPPDDELNERVGRGDMPLWPTKIFTTDDPELQIIRSVILKCYTTDPAKRPSARKVAIVLDRALQKLKQDYGSQTKGNH